MRKNIVCYIVYNRLEKVKKSIIPILKYNPEKLIVYQDGYKEGDEINNKECDIVEKYIKNIISGIDYVYIKRKKNYGSTLNISMIVNEIFEIYDQEIFIEDDCVFSNSAFEYIDYYLESYKNISKVLSISAYNPVNIKESELDLFSSHFMCWGWASWARVFKGFPKHVYYNEYINKLLKKYADGNYLKYLLWRLELFNKNKTNSWDSSARVHLLKKNIEGLVLYPSKNLVENIGFDAEATRTSYGRSNKISYNYNIKKPDTIELNKNFEYRIDREHYNTNMARIIVQIIKIISPKIQYKMKYLYLYLYKKL